VSWPDLQIRGTFLELKVASPTCAVRRCRSSPPVAFFESPTTPHKASMPYGAHSTNKVEDSPLQACMETASVVSTDASLEGHDDSTAHTPSEPMWETLEPGERWSSLAPMAWETVTSLDAVFPSLDEGSPASPPKPQCKKPQAQEKQQQQVLQQQQQQQKQKQEQFRQEAVRKQRSEKQPWKRQCVPKVVDGVVEAVEKSEYCVDLAVCWHGPSHCLRGLTVTARMCIDDIRHAEELMNTAKETILEQLSESKGVRVLGPQKNPFQPTPRGFDATLVKEMPSSCKRCIETGFCGHGRCRMLHHPSSTMFFTFQIAALAREALTHEALGRSGP